jgi:hypothetical protein
MEFLQGIQIFQSFMKMSKYKVHKNGMKKLNFYLTLILNLQID